MLGGLHYTTFANFVVAKKETRLELGLYTTIYNAFRNAYVFLKFIFLTILADYKLLNEKS